jgi:hypothetical protein
MELLILIGVLVTLDVLAFRFGADSRDLGAREYHDRLIMAAGRGDPIAYDATVLAKEIERLQRLF